MFRSGTTLLARMLNAHPEIVCLSDPCLPFFKYFRSYISLNLGLNISPESPLDDYYYKPEMLSLFNLIQESDLDCKIPLRWKDSIKEDIIKYGYPYSPLIMDDIKELSVTTFKNLLQDILDLGYTVYGKNKKPKLIGFKEVWTDEFIPPLIRTFNDIKILILLRDPRAVSSSKNITSDKYPWLFLARQWRKLAGLAFHYKNIFSDRVLLIYYEKLISNPEKEIYRILDHLNLSFHPNLLDFSKYLDGFNRPWIQNTSYGNGLQGFNKDSITRWKSFLTCDEENFIKLICGPEMYLHGYLSSFSFKGLPFFINNPLCFSLSEIALWIKKYSSVNPVDVSLETSKEYLRKSLFITKSENIDLIKISFLFENIFYQASKGYQE